MYRVDCPNLPIGRSEDFGERGNWNRIIYGRLAVVGSMIGYGSVVYFPYSIMQYKAIYLIPFLTLFLLIGIPLFTIELALGQYLNRGPIKGFSRLAPIVSGLGWGMVMISMTTSIYYNLYLTESLMLFVRYIFHYFGHVSGEEVSADTCSFVSSAPPVSSDFYEEHLMYFMLSWVFVGLFISKGFQYSTKLLVVTNVLPYFLLLVLFIIKIFYAPSDNNEFYSILNFSWDKLFNVQMWLDAVTHILFTLGIGFGTHTTLSSYNKKRHKFMLDVILIPLADFTTSAVCTYLIYEHLHKKGNESVLMILCTFSKKMYEEQATGFIYLIFYLLGLACQLAMVETVITGIMDQYHKLRHCHSYVVFATCFVLSMLGVYMAFNLEVYKYTKDVSSKILLIFGLLLALTAPIFCKNFDKIKKEMHLQPYGLFEMYLKFCWTYLCPVVLIISTLGHFVTWNWCDSLGSKLTVGVFFLVAVAFSVLKCRTLNWRDWFRATEDFATEEHRRKRHKLNGAINSITTTL